MIKFVRIVEAKQQAIEPEYKRFLTTCEKQPVNG